MQPALNVLSFAVHRHTFLSCLWHPEGHDSIAEVRHSINNCTGTGWILDFDPHQCPLDSPLHNMPGVVMHKDSYLLEEPQEKVCRICSKINYWCQSNSSALKVWRGNVKPAQRSALPGPAYSTKGTKAEWWIANEFLCVQANDELLTCKSEHCNTGIQLWDRVFTEICKWEVLWAADQICWFFPLYFNRILNNGAPNMEKQDHAKENRSCWEKKSGSSAIYKGEK